MITNSNNATPEERRRFYGDRVKGKLKEFLDSIKSESISDQVNISEELALYRYVTLQNVAYYQAAMESDNIGAAMEAGEMLQAKLKGVADIAKIASSIEAQGKDKVSIYDLTLLIDKLVDAIYLECEKANRRDIAESIEMQIRDSVNITLNPKGATVTPDQDVRAMINSVPSIVNDE